MKTIRSHSSLFVVFISMVIIFISFQSCDDDRDVTSGEIAVFANMAAQGPEILTFTVSPPSGLIDGQFLFSWQTVNASKVTIEPAITDPDFVLPLSGTLVGRVPYSQHYTLIAEQEGFAKRVIRSVWIDVRYPGGSSWRFPRGTMMNSARSAYPGPTSGRIAWLFSTAEYFTDKAIIMHDGSLCLAGGELIVLNPDGCVTWRLERRTTYDGFRNAVLAEDGTLYCDGGRHGGLLALSPDGNELWTEDYESYEPRSLLLGPDNVIVVGTTGIDYGETWGNLLYITPQGELLEDVPMGTVQGLAFTADFSKLIYYSYHDSNGSRLDCRHYRGGLEWYSLIPYVSSVPITDSCNRVFVRTQSDIRSLDSNGSERWKISSIQQHVPDWAAQSNMAQGGSGRIYAVGCDQTYEQPIYLYSLHPDGAILWRREIQGAVNEPENWEDRVSMSPVVDAEERIYVPAAFSITAFSGDGNKLWEYDDPEEHFTNLVLSMDGTLYAQGRKGIYAFRD